MDADKRNRLVSRLSSEDEPRLVPIDEFFDGNDDSASIGCNLIDHPGIEMFRSTFEQLRSRRDVVAAYAQISEVDPGEESWPFADTILIVGEISIDVLRSLLRPLEPDEVGPCQDDKTNEIVQMLHEAPCRFAWWD